MEATTSLEEFRERMALPLDESAPIRRDPFGIVDYLQLAAFSRRSLEFGIQRGKTACGWIRVVAGEVWSAQFGQRSGLEAIAALIAASFDHVEITELAVDPGPRDVEVSIHGLLLELARLEDEAREQARGQLEGHFDGQFDGQLGALSPAPPKLESAAPEPSVDLQDQQAVRELLDVLGRSTDSQAITEHVDRLAPGRAQARLWLRALGRRRDDASELPVDARVHLLGFASARAQGLVAKLERRGIAAVEVDEDAVLERAVRPALLVVQLGLPDDDVDLEAQTLARFDLLWAVRVAGRQCPWIAVTDRPTRFGTSLCAALGAASWFLQEPVDPDDEQLAEQLEAYLQARGTAPGSQTLGCLDLALMLADLEVDACVSLDHADGRGQLDVRDGQLLACTLERDGQTVVGIDAAAQLCAWEQRSVAVLPPRPNAIRNLPHGLPLALAALASTMASPTRLRPRAVEKQEFSMANLNSVCEAIVDDVPDAVACGVVDLDTGMLMGIHHKVSYFTQSYLDAVAAAAVDMFRGKNVRRVERLLSKHRGQEITDAFEEIFISSPAVFHFMKSIPSKSAVVVLVTRKSTNQGMGWSSLRVAVDDIVAALP